MPFDQIIRLKGLEIVMAEVRSMDEVVQRASPQRYSSPFNGSSLMNRQDVGGCLSLEDRGHPPTIVDFDLQHAVARGQVLEEESKARLGPARNRR
jgi:hypothetical protein